METLQVLKNNAVKAFNEADDKGKTLLSNLFGNQTFGKITDQVKTFEDALAIIDISKAKFEHWADNLSPDEIAYGKLKIIARALNEGWTPDWNNTDQAKYYPYFDMRSGCAFYDVVCNCGYSGVSSRLCFKSSELAEYAATQFADLYKAFMVL